MSSTEKIASLHELLIFPTDASNLEDEGIVWDKVYHLSKVGCDVATRGSVCCIGNRELDI